MTIDEGYVKYTSHWTEGPPPDAAIVDLLETWRAPLYSAGLIGHYEDLGVGYGNISVRHGARGQFVISGTQTGHLSRTGRDHYSLVTNYDIDANDVSCVGAVQASSESLTHAAIYEVDPGINAIVHVHSRLLWNRLLNRVPTTNADVAYGTPEMAREFARLYRDTDFASTGIAVMGGHDEGIISIGHSLEQAARRVLDIARDPD